MTSATFLPQFRNQGPRKTEEAVDCLLFETSRLLVTSDADKHLHGEIAPSKVAPPYVREFIDNPDANEEESSTSPFLSSCSRSFEEMQMFRKKIQDEDRLVNMFKLKHNFSSRFDNRAWVHPHGTTNFDYQGIPARRRMKVELFKTAIRKENYMYLGSHPEIQAIISLFLKKLLTTQPPDAAEYLAEYCCGHLQNPTEFERHIEVERKKLSLYHVKKMRNAGKIIIRPGGSSIISEKPGEEEYEYVPEVDGNYFKKMNIGALAQDFSFEGVSGLMAAKEKKAEEDEKRKKKKKKPHKYCGCKDWKLKKNQQRTNTNNSASTNGSVGRQSTRSTLGNVDTLPTSEEEDSDEEFEFSPEDAERIASELIYQFLDPVEGVYSSNHRSLGSFKNIQ